MNVSVVGGSGYIGGELIRLLLEHPEVSLQQVTSERLAGKFIQLAHPNLRNATDLRFSRSEDLENCDILFVATPHGFSMNHMADFFEIAPRIIDLSSDFRLRHSELYERWYGYEHTNPDLLESAVYGITELHRDEIRKASLVACAGCLATSAILALAPLARRGVIDREHIVVDSKIGSSASGNKSSDSSHHPERANVVRCYGPTMHRHTAEMEQELDFGNDIRISFSPHAVDMVRGIMTTSHLFLTEDLDDRAIWELYREQYADEPFIRIVKERQGVYRYPEAKLLIGSNYCDIGFERESRANRLVVMSAIDNLVKGGAGQAVQNMNVMCDFDEKTGLEHMGFHPI